MKRAGMIARRAVQMLEMKQTTGTRVAPIGKTDRYHLYKVNGTQFPRLCADLAHSPFRPLI